MGDNLIECEKSATTTVVYVGNISNGSDRSTIRYHVRKLGGPYKALHMRNGHAFVVYESFYHAEQAIKQLQHTSIDGSGLWVSVASETKAKMLVDMEEPPSQRSLFIGNLAQSIRESHLRQRFERYGKITSIRVPKHYATGDTRGFAFVEFESSGDAELAIRAENGKLLHDSPMDIDWCRDGATHSGGNVYGMPPPPRQSVINSSNMGPNGGPMISYGPDSRRGGGGGGMRRQNSHSHSHGHGGNNGGGNNGVGIGIGIVDGGVSGMNGMNSVSSMSGGGMNSMSSMNGMNSMNPMNSGNGNSGNGRMVPRHYHATENITTARFAGHGAHSSHTGHGGHSSHGAHGAHGVHHQSHSSRSGHGHGSHEGRSSHHSHGGHHAGHHGGHHGHQGHHGSSMHNQHQQGNNQAPRMMAIPELSGKQLADLPTMQLPDGQVVHVIPAQFMQRMLSCFVEVVSHFFCFVLLPLFFVFVLFVCNVVVGSLGILGIDVNVLPNFTKTNDNMK